MVKDGCLAEFAAAHAQQNCGKAGAFLADFFTELVNDLDLAGVHQLGASRAHAGAADGLGHCLAAFDRGNNFFIQAVDFCPILLNLGVR